MIGAGPLAGRTSVAPILDFARVRRWPAVVGFAGRTHASSDPVNARERTKLWVEWVREKLAPKVTP